MKTSYSQNSTYAACSMMWKLKYVDKIKTPENSSALFFGTAVDQSIMSMLENPHSSPEEIFKKLWTIGKNYKKEDIKIYDSTVIKFNSSDFDIDVIRHFSDENLLTSWIKEFNLSEIGDDGYSVFKSIAENKKQTKYPQKIPIEQFKFYNRCCWQSMYRKGLLLIQSFKTKFIPTIDEIVAVQIPASIEDSEIGDSIVGYIDMVLRIKGLDKNIIFDLKTSSKPYEQSVIDNSDQLTIYLAMAGEKYNTDLVGYVVLSKNINKISTSKCKTCGNIKQGRPRTCDAMLSSPDSKKLTRCNGEWEETITLDPLVQVMIKGKTQEEVEAILNTQAEIIFNMKTNVVVKNLNMCNNYYGRRCDFYNICNGKGK